MMKFLRNPKRLLCLQSGTHYWTFIWFLTVLIGGHLSCPARLIAQDPLDGAPNELQINTDDPEEVKKRTPEYQSALDAMRAHVFKMREIIVRHSVSMTAEEDQKLRRDFSNAQMEGHRLFDTMIDAALAQFLADPENNSATEQMLYEVVKDSVEMDRFENMLPVAQALINRNFDGEKLKAYMALSAIAMNQWELAKPFVSHLSELGISESYLHQLNDELEGLKEKWQKELSEREKDAAGEPLPQAIIRTTKGDVLVELFENNAPGTVGTFISLAEQGFYDNLEFHRVLQHFMAQTGCPIGDGTGGPGFYIYSEASRPDARPFFRGTLGIAIASDPNTGLPLVHSGGSQFFVTYVPTFELEGTYTSFGRVLTGMEVVASLTRVNPDEKPAEGEPPVIPDRVLNIEIVRKRDHEYVPNKLQTPQESGIPAGTK
ncbi:MAG: peptidylprolyl isomerase [Planctomycetales bacterium]|nr:peptidylprolyl isomerase [Planctomycetales bacterium]